VIIPVYNGERYLRECLDSALAQTHAPSDVVVVNDGSTDGTAEILREYRERVIILEQENRGQGAAVNRAVANSTGELIAFLDCDDCWDPRKLERQVAVFERFPEAIAVYCDHRRIDAAGKITAPTGALAYVRCSGQVLRSLIHGNFIISPSTVMVRASAFHAVGGFDEANPALGSKDYGLWLRMATQGSFIYLAETLTGYRHHAHNISAGFGYRRILCDLAALRGLEPFLERFPDENAKADYRQRLYETTLGAAWYCTQEGNRVDSLGYYLRALRMKPLRLFVWMKAVLALVAPKPPGGKKSAQPGH
jgi:glycosyltransferase involved in cell wall biosynthesis